MFESLNLYYSATNLKTIKTEKHHITDQHITDQQHKHVNLLLILSRQLAVPYPESVILIDISTFCNPYNILKSKLKIFNSNQTSVFAFLYEIQYFVF